MSVGVQPGQDPLSGGQQTALASALGRVGPPNNPKTLVQRTDPQYLWLSKLHSIRKSIDECIQESLDERPPDEQTLVTAMRHATDRLIKGINGQEASLKLASEATAAFAPELSAQADQKLGALSGPPTVPGAPQMSGPPPPPMMGGGPQGPPAGGSPPGMPGGMPPVSPPTFGG